MADVIAEFAKRYNGPEVPQNYTSVLKATDRVTQTAGSSSRHPSYINAIAGAALVLAGIAGTAGGAYWMGRQIEQGVQNLDQEKRDILLIKQFLEEKTNLLSDPNFQEAYNEATKPNSLTFRYDRFPDVASRDYQGNLIPADPNIEHISYVIYTDPSVRAGTFSLNMTIDKRDNKAISTYMSFNLDRNADFDPIYPQVTPTTMFTEDETRGILDNLFKDKPDSVTIYPSPPSMQYDHIAKAETHRDGLRINASVFSNGMVNYSLQPDPIQP